MISCAHTTQIWSLPYQQCKAKYHWIKLIFEEEQEEEKKFIGASCAPFHKCGIIYLKFHSSQSKPHQTKDALWMRVREKTAN